MVQPSDPWVRLRRSVLQCAVSWCGRAGNSCRPRDAFCPRDRPRQMRKEGDEDAGRPTRWCGRVDDHFPDPRQHLDRIHRRTVRDRWRPLCAVRCAARFGFKEATHENGPCRPLAGVEGEDAASKPASAQGTAERGTSTATTPSSPRSSHSPGSASYTRLRTGEFRSASSQWKARTPRSRAASVRRRSNNRPKPRPWNSSTTRADDADYLAGRVLEAGHDCEVHLAIDIAQLAQLVRR